MSRIRDFVTVLEEHKFRFNGWTWSYVEITPDQAGKIFGLLNEGNRPKRSAGFFKWQKAMLSGEWVHSPETLIVCDDGMLLNGQHRLKALSMTTKPQRFTMVEGVPRSICKHLDRCITRNTSDLLGTRKYLQATIGTIMELAIPSASNRTLSLVEQYNSVFMPFVELIAERASGTGGRAENKFRCSSVRAAFAVKMAQDYGSVDPLLDYWEAMVKYDPECLVKIPRPLQLLAGMIHRGELSNAGIKDRQTTMVAAWCSLRSSSSATSIIRITEKTRENAIGEMRSVIAQLIGGTK